MPVSSWVEQREELHLAGRHDQKTHGNRGGSTVTSADVAAMSPDEFADLLNTTAAAQRGAPEQAMHDIQAAGGSVYSWAVEHVGDLTHRINEHGGALGTEFVKPKVDRALDALTHPYGFEREMNEQIESNRRYREGDEGRHRPYTKDEVVELGQVYADAHKQVPVYNLPSRFARDAAVAVGEMRFGDAVGSLRELKQAVDDPAGWRSLMSQDATIDFLERLERSEQFHLQGQHDQKTHGNRGGAPDGYTETGDDHLGQPIYERPDGDGFAIHANDGELLEVRYEGKKRWTWSEDWTKEALTSLADAYNAMPYTPEQAENADVGAIHPPEVVIERDSPYGADVLAYTNVRGGGKYPAGVIVLNMDNRGAHLDPGESMLDSMPVHAYETTARYNTAHEYGHVIQAMIDQPGPVTRFAERPGVDPLLRKFGSRYARTSPLEAHAEAFAEWALTGGATSNPFVEAYAEHFDWEHRQPGQRAIAASAPSSLADRIVTVIDTATGPRYVLDDGTIVDPAAGVAEFHLQGQHDQKTHGNRHGAVGRAPKGYQVGMFNNAERTVSITDPQHVQFKKRVDNLADSIIEELDGYRGFMSRYPHPKQYEGVTASLEAMPSEIVDSIDLLIEVTHGAYRLNEPITGEPADRLRAEAEQLKKAVKEATSIPFTETFQVPPSPPTPWSRDPEDPLRIVSEGGQIEIVDAPPALSTRKVATIMDAAQRAIESNPVLDQVPIKIRFDYGLADDGPLGAVEGVTLGYVAAGRFGNDPTWREVNLHPGYATEDRPAANLPMGSQPLVEGLRWTVMHELGHTAAFERARIDGDPFDRWAKEAIPVINDGRTGLMSGYGKTSTLEAHAEAFAEWANTGGTTNNPVVQWYADAFGWEEPVNADIAQLAADAASRAVLVSDDSDELLERVVSIKDVTATIDTVDGPIYEYRDTAAFHLQGQHDQSTHGNRDSSPASRSGWKTIDDVTSDRPVEFDDYENTYRIRAANGEWIHAQVVGGDQQRLRAPEWRQRTVDLLNGTIDAYDAAPIDGVVPNVLVTSELPFGLPDRAAGATAMVRSDAKPRPGLPPNEAPWHAANVPGNTILVNASTTAEASWAAVEIMGSEFMMPSVDDVGAARYTGAHEYGHVRLYLADSVPAVDQLYADLFPESLGTWTPEWKAASRYAKSNAREMHAEAFAEWVLSDGTNDLASRYADEFGWGREEERALAAAAPKDDSMSPGWIIETPDGPVEVDDDGNVVVYPLDSDAFHLQGQHDQQTHGNRGGRSTVRSAQLQVPDFDKLPPKLQRKIQKRLEEITGLDEAALRDHIAAKAAKYTKAAIDMGDIDDLMQRAEFYQRWHDTESEFIDRLNDTYGTDLTVEQQLAASAALASMRDPAVQVPHGRQVALALAQDLPIEVTQAEIDSYQQWRQRRGRNANTGFEEIDVEPGMHQPSDLPAGFLATRLSYMNPDGTVQPTYKSLNTLDAVKAINILRGHSPNSTINPGKIPSQQLMQLSGAKLREYAAAPIDTSGSAYVLDTWMYRGLLEDLPLLVGKTTGARLTTQQAYQGDLIRRAGDPSAVRQAPGLNDLFQSTPASTGTMPSSTGTYPLLKRIVVDETVGLVDAAVRDAGYDGPQLTPMQTQAILWSGIRAEWNDRATSDPFADGEVDKYFGG